MPHYYIHDNGEGVQLSEAEMKIYRAAFDAERLVAHYPPNDIPGWVNRARRRGRLLMRDIDRVAGWKAARLTPPKQ